MNDQRAVTGILSHIKFAKTSGDMKLEVTIPHEMADEAYHRLGGNPNPSESRWIAIAVLDKEKKE